MNTRIKYLGKNLGILTISNFASKILVFLLVPLYTSVLSTQDFGVYDLVVSTIALIYPIVTLNVIEAVVRFLLEDLKYKEDIAYLCSRTLIISLIPVAAFLTFNRVVGYCDVINGLEIYIAFYYTFFIVNQFLIQYAKGNDRFWDMGIAGVIGTIIMIFTNILFLIVLHVGLRGFFTANILSQLIPSTYLFIRLKFWNSFSKGHNNRQLFKEMLMYCMPLTAVTLGWWVNNASDKYVVTAMCGVAANGLLSVSYKIPQIISTLQTIFTQAWQISAIKEYGERDTAHFYGRTFNVINVLICAACSWLIILTKPLAHILYQKEFFMAWQYVPLLIVSCVLNSASGFLGPILSAKKASKSMAMSAVYGASANVVMNILFVYLVGIQGATIATVISSFIIYAVRKRVVGDEIKIEGYGIVLITWGLLCVQAILEIYTPFWWLEVILIAVMLILNWNGLKSIMGMCKSLVMRR